MASITVLGPGGWGIALAMTAYECGHNVTLWSPFKDEVEMLLEKRTNERLLSGVVIPDAIKITNDISCAEGSLITIIATPSTAVRSAAAALKGISSPGIIVNVSKGFEKDSFARLSEVVSDEIPNIPIVVLSGPSHAEEVAKRVPTSLVAASDDNEAARIVQDALSNEFLRIYTSEDVVGVELGGALKNVIAVCAGICDGLGLGDNTKAALMTRGLAEMTRLGISMGADTLTLSGLAGLGDLIVTCTSQHSRNNRFGNMVGRGVSVELALKKVGTVEGYYAAAIAYELGKRHKIDLPIINECYEILYEGRAVDAVVNNLMLRPKGPENYK